VPGREVGASPVLVGRDELLALADRRLAQAGTGRGHLLFLSGEAGIGKTRLLASIARRAERQAFDVVRGAAFHGDEESSGGVLLDLAGDLRRATEPAVQGVGRALSDRLRDPMVKEGDQHHQRRFLIQDLVEILTDLDGERRRLVVLEDLHWADQLSLEVVAHLAARLAMRSTLMIGAYRSDELFAHAPMREWRQRLVSQRLAEEIRLPRLTIAQTATLASSMLGGTAPSQLVTAIHDRADGIPLHIEELLAATDALLVPDTLADAVLARAAGLDETARDIAAAATVIGRSFDFDLLVAVTQQKPEAVDRCLRQLRSTYLVQAGNDQDVFDFRHALIRDALYADIPLPRRRELHERVGVVAVDRGYGAAFVSAQFDQANLAALAYQHSRVAAAQASAASAHREALQLYRRALRNLPPDLAPHDHASLLAALGHEAAAVDENDAAATALAQAHAIWYDAGDLLAAADLVPSMVAVGHLLGEGLDSRVSRLQTALSTLAEQPAAGPVRARLLSGLATAYLVNDGLDEAIDYSEQSRTLSQATGDPQAALDTAATLGSVLMFSGRVDAGWELLEDAAARAVDLLYEAEAARSYRMGGTSASALVEYDRAERWLITGMDYAESVELWNHRSYMAAHLAHVQWACGKWVSAEETAEQALADGRGGITTRITAHYVLGYLAMGRGDWARATALLDEALDEGEDMGELQRISPPLWGLAETAVLRGEPEAAVTMCERGLRLSTEVGDAAYLYPYLVTGARAHLARRDIDGAEDWGVRVERALLRRSIPGTLPALDHVRGLVRLARGEHDRARVNLQNARTAWNARARFWEGTWAVLDEARCAVASRRYAEATELAVAARTAGQGAGATTLVASADALIPESRRARQRWHPLTAREYDVALLVADGMTNREIAARLVLSPKTVSAHVEHILTKLGVGRRAEIAAWAARIET
jgi:DNA-binding CsgD family transcriptional regulator